MQGTRVLRWKRQTFQELTKRLKCELSVSPNASLIDEEVTVVGSGLPANTVVTLETNLLDMKQKFDFVSSCSFLTDSAGEFSTARCAPLPGGSYSGLHPSGPLWSVKPGPGSLVRLWPRDILASLPYRLVLRRQDSGATLATAAATKRFVTAGVRRLAVRVGRLRGTLFLPAGGGRGPGVITLYGGVAWGGVPEDRAALLASRGFVTFALAFFGVEDLPPTYSEFDIEYFEEAVDWLLSRPEVSSPHVGLFGSSTGGSISLSMMQFLGAKVGACAVINANFVSAPGPSKYKGSCINKSEFADLAVGGNPEVDNFII